MSYFVPDKVAIKNLLRGPDGMVAKHFHSMGRRATAMAKRQVGVDTGALKASIGYSVRASGGPIMVRIGSANRIALLHHEGSVPHIIRPVKSQTLRFKTHGKIVYAKIVHHPGTKPNPYLTTSMRAVI